MFRQLNGWRHVRDSNEKNERKPVSSISAQGSKAFLKSYAVDPWETKQHVQCIGTITKQT